MVDAHVANSQVLLLVLLVVVSKYMSIFYMFLAGQQAIQLLPILLHCSLCLFVFQLVLLRLPVLSAWIQLVMRVWTYRELCSNSACLA